MKNTSLMSIIATFATICFAFACDGPASVGATDVVPTETPTPATVETDAAAPTETAPPATEATAPVETEAVTTIEAEPAAAATGN